MSLYYYCEILSVWQKKANIDFGLLSYTFLKKDPNGTSDSFFSMLLIYSPLSIKKNQRFLQPCDKTEPWNFVMKSSHLPYLISITVDAQLHKLLSEFLKSYWWKQIWVVYSSSFAQFGHIFVFFFLSFNWMKARKLLAKSMFDFNLFCFWRYMVVYTITILNFWVW